MKKTGVLSVFLFISFFYAAVACAEPKELPKGTVVSAKIVEPGIAEVTISGPINVVNFEYYSTKRIIKMGSGAKYKINLQDGRRFNFVFRDKDGKSYYALISDDTSENTDFIGDGVSIDCSDSRGCCFIIK